MNLTDKDIEILEDYKSGALTEGERQALEKRLADDFDFRRQALLHWAIEASIPIAAEQRTRDFLNEINQKLPPLLPPPPQNPWLRYLLVALALALAAFAIWYFTIREEKPKLSPMVASVFEAYPAVGITMGDTKEDIKLNALRTYASNDFKAAIPLLQKAFENEKDSLLLLYKAIAYIGNGVSEQATPILKNMQNSSSLPTESIHWYLALSYLETNQKALALPILEQLKNTEGEYRDKAAELLKKIF